MEFSEAFRAEDISKTDFFDFVVTPEDMGNDIVLHNNFPPWSRKSIGLFGSNNHNHTSSADDANGSAPNDLHPTKEANNNNILTHFADDSFWDTGGGKAAFAAAAAAVNIKMESPTLDDINDICWPSTTNDCGVVGVSPPEPGGDDHHQQNAANQRLRGDKPQGEPGADGSNTDGSIYTLTVVNGHETPRPPTLPPPPQAPPLWYRPPDLSSILREGDEQLRQAMSSMDPGGQFHHHHHHQTSLDIDSLDIISILPSLPSMAESLGDPMDHGLFSGPPDPGLQQHHGGEDLLASSGGGGVSSGGGGVCDDSGFVESKEDQMNQQRPSSSSQNGGLQDQSTPSEDNRASYTENNNDWAFSNHNDSSGHNESLLRSALQGGKSYLNQYNGMDSAKTLTELGPPGMFMSGGDAGGGGGIMSMDGGAGGPGSVMMFDDLYGNGPASAASQCTSTCTSTTCMDDILLSPLDDYEKLKMIENEVVESAKRYGLHHYGSAVHPAASSSGTSSAPVAHSSTPPPRPKKKSAKSSKVKASSGSSGVSSSGGQASGGGSSDSAAPSANGSARRERSLHHCTICSKAFKDKYSVNVHIRTHTGEKPFACSVCGKSFRQKAHLAKHYHTHIVQKSELPPKSMSTKAR